jgi:NADH:ubiquinone oxidoreductase subunit K
MFIPNVFTFLNLVVFLFLLSLSGIFLTRRNFIIVLMCIELMLLSINFAFLIFSVHLDDFTGQLFTLFVLTVAAAESSLGLAILVVYYRLRGIISVDNINLIKS